MTSFNLNRPFDYDSDVNMNEILERFDPYIISQVKRLANCRSHLAHPIVVSPEIDEIIQKVRIKFWRASQEKQIQHPQAYIQRIICNEFNDIGRRRKLPLPLSIDGEEAVNLGKIIVALGEGMDDPVYEFEKKEAVADCIDAVAVAVSELPPRQQLAMICLLFEQVDDIIQLVKALKAHSVNVEVVQWPADEVEAHRLKASISAARHKIAQRMVENVSVCKRSNHVRRASGK